jgi:hypothetical protein
MDAQNLTPITDTEKLIPVLIAVVLSYWLIK